MKLEFDSLVEVEEFMLQLGWVKAAQPSQASGAVPHGLVSDQVNQYNPETTRDQGSVARSFPPMDRHPQDPRPYTSGQGIVMGQVDDKADRHSVLAADVARRVDAGHFEDFAKLKTVRQVVMAIKGAKPDITADTVVETCLVLVDEDKCPVLTLLPDEDMETRVRSACEALGIT
jgi:hypothetical protein